MSTSGRPAPAARRLARFVRDLPLDRVPAPVVGNAADLVLDTLGTALAATPEDFGRAVLAVARELGGRPESALLGDRARVATANAVLANVTLAHGLDFDDTREDAIVPTGCVAVTTALAVGEATGADGRARLEAVVAAGNAALTLPAARAGRIVDAVAALAGGGPVTPLLDALTLEDVRP